MTLRALRTPLTLAVLSLLREGPHHPYEMQAAVRGRHVDEVVKLRGGSLYDAVRRLERAGLVRALDTEREGARPERTRYEITDAGVETVRALTRDYLRRPAEEYPVFAAALAHIVNVGPDDAVALLRERQRTIRSRHDQIADELAPHLETLPRVVILEVEYAQAMRRAELDWLAAAISDIEAGELRWLELPSERRPG